jgi:hypothetical protein
VVIHVTDACGHGEDFCPPTTGDNHPGEGTPARAKDILKKMAAMGMYYFLGNMNSETAFFFAGLAKHAPKGGLTLATFDFKNVKDFGKLLSSSVTTATAKTMSMSRIGDDEKEPPPPPYIARFHDPPRPGDPALLPIRGFELCWGGSNEKIPKNRLKELLMKLDDAQAAKNLYVQRPCQFMKDREAFNQGACRAAYYGYVEGEKDLYVIKKALVQGAKQNLAQAEAQRALEVTAIAATVAELFNLRLLEKGRPEQVSFAQIRIFLEGKTVYEVEKHLGAGDFVKYNSNVGFVVQDGGNKVYGQLAQTLSHFSCGVSKEKLILVDLQGIDLKFTDVAMHSMFITEPQLPTDLMDEGMSSFFKSHECNEFCKLLGLKVPKRWAPDEDEDEDDDA